MTTNDQPLATEHPSVTEELAGLMRQAAESAVEHQYDEHCRDVGGVESQPEAVLEAMRPTMTALAREDLRDFETRMALGDDEAQRGAEEIAAWREAYDRLQREAAQGSKDGWRLAVETVEAEDLAHQEMMDRLYREAWLTVRPTVKRRVETERQVRNRVMGEWRK